MPKLNTVHETEPEIQINVEISGGQIIFLAADPAAHVHVHAPVMEYMGRFLHKQDKRLIFGMFAETKNGFAYKENDSVSISFVETKSMFSFNASVIEVRKASADEKPALGEIPERFGNVEEYDKYILEIVPTTVPEKKQRREFFRMPLGIDIYYKPIEEYEIKDIESGKLKFELTPVKDAEKDSGGAVFEENKGFLKLTTMDVSAGGFRCSTITKFNEGIMLNCMLIVGYEALPAIAQVLKVKPSDDEPGLYDIRAIFYKISDPVRDRVVKYMFFKQRQIQSRFFKRKF